MVLSISIVRAFTIGMVCKQVILHSQTHPAFAAAFQSIASRRRKLSPQEKPNPFTLERFISSKNIKLPLSVTPGIPTTVQLATAGSQRTTSSSQKAHFLLGRGRIYPPVNGRGA